MIYFSCSIHRRASDLRCWHAFLERDDLLFLIVRWRLYLVKVCPISSDCLFLSRLQPWIILLPSLILPQSSLEVLQLERSYSSEFNEGFRVLDFTFIAFGPFRRTPLCSYFIMSAAPTWKSWIHLTTESWTDAPCTRTPSLIAQSSSLFNPS